jgi:hypothetical protein
MCRCSITSYGGLKKLDGYLPCPGTCVSNKLGDTDVAKRHGIIRTPCCAVMNNARHAKDIHESLYSDSCIQLENKEVMVTGKHEGKDMQNVNAEWA